MDEAQKDNQDLVVGDDGLMNQESQEENKTIENSSTNIDVKSDEAPVEESINETTPPPDDAAVMVDDSKESSDESTAEDAVSFIAGTNTEDTGAENKPIVNSTEAAKEDSVEQTETENLEGSHVVQAPAEETVESTQAEDLANTTEEKSISHDNSATPQEATGAVVQPDKSGMSNNEHNNPHEHRNNKKLALIVTLAVALVLSGVAIYAYLSAQNNTEESSSGSNTSNVESTELIPNNEEITPATQNDIDETINEIDQTIDTLDNSELNDESLSDDTLEL